MIYGTERLSASQSLFRSDPCQVTPSGFHAATPWLPIPVCSQKEIVPKPLPGWLDTMLGKKKVTFCWNMANMFFLIFGLIEFNLEAHQSFLEQSSTWSCNFKILKLYRCAETCRNHRQGGHVKIILQFRPESLRQLRKSSRFNMIQPYSHLHMPQLRECSRYL